MNTPSDDVIRATFITCHQIKFQIRGINKKNLTEIPQIMH